MENKIDLKKGKSFQYWTKKEFKALPLREWKEDIGEFDSLIILPNKRSISSGFLCMYFVAVKGDNPFCLLGGYSDVINLDGIGGNGKYEKNRPALIMPKGWSIDFLKKSKLLRIFSNDKLTAGEMLSSFSLYSVRDADISDNTVLHRF